MSRTKRRTSGNMHYAFDNYYKPHESYERVRIDDVSWWQWIKIKVILSKEQTAEKLAKYHSDAGCGYTTCKCKWGRNEKSFRSHCKQEIVKFNKDVDHHPVQIQTKRFLRGWWN